MRTVIALSVLVWCACSSSPTKAVYQAAGKGAAKGTLATQMIDSAGGTVTSADGRLELTIPAGALAAGTAVTIQPITNTAPNGSGVAYRLGPEGTTFTNPVTVTFHLSAAEVLGIDSGFIAAQRSDGMWASQPGQTRDAMSKTVSVKAKHFSDWAFLQTLQLKPPNARLRSNTSQDFEPIILYDPSLDEELANPVESEVAVMLPTHFSHQFSSETGRHWAVNGANGGTNATGLVAQQGDNGHYTAPPSRPTPSTVSVSLTVELGTRRVTAPASVDIYDQERWSGNSDITFIDGTKLASNWTFVQVGDPIDGEYTFDVEGGTANYTPLDMQNGCPLTVDPLTHVIVAGEGMMTATYDVTTGPDSPMVTGNGITVWAATFTTYCAAGPKDIPGTVDGQWWPSNGPAPVQADNGAVDITVSTGLASGMVHLSRQ